MIIELFLSLAIGLALYISIRLLKRVFKRLSKVKQVTEKRIFYIEKVFEALFIVVAIMLLLFVWSVDMKSVALFASSFFAIAGVALFAQWSILSNVTASIIIFFNFPAKIGDRIKIVDGDNTLEGIITEISLFQTEMLDDDGNTLFYPNNVILQKPVIKIKNRNLKTNLSKENNEKESIVNYQV